MSDILSIGLMVFILVQWYFIIMLVDRALPRNEKEAKILDMRKWFNKRLRSLKKKDKTPSKKTGNEDKGTMQSW